MATNKIPTVTFFLLLLLISHLIILPIGARRLKHCKRCSTKHSQHLHSSGGGAETTAWTANSELDEYQPTTPGRSPGVGHSILPNSFSNELDEFRRTAPGRSPGIGHSDQNSTIINNGTAKNQPSAGSSGESALWRSHGVGHAVLNSATGEVDVYPPGGADVGQPIQTKLDQYRPTAPGRSPGVGH